jgi:DEAD/DEAH box helicase domain-containing protein
MEPSEKPIAYKNKRILFFDLETIRGADQVGGWSNIRKMGLAVAVIYDSIEKKYIRYFEHDSRRLIEKLLSADLVVGFNHVRFDYEVLKPYTTVDLPAYTANFDIMLDLEKKLGHRIGLGHLGKETLGRPKSADGLVSLKWWADGETEKVADYCQVDVEITREIFEFGLSNRHLVYRNRRGEKTVIDLDWDLSSILATTKKRQKPIQSEIDF